MKGILGAFCETAWEQITASRSKRTWVAYTRSGKVVVLEGDRVIKVVTPRKGGYAK